MNWVSKALYLERKIKKLEEMIEHLTSHIQVDEDGNVVIEAEGFDISANSKIKILSYDSISLSTHTSVSGKGDIDISVNGTSGNTTLSSYDGDVAVYSTSGSLKLSADSDLMLRSYSGVIDVQCFENFVLKTNRSIELQPDDSLTSTKALEVVE